MERREHVPDITTTADQILEDLRSDPRTLAETQIKGIWNVGNDEFSDALGTIVSNLAVDPPDYVIQEDDLIALVIELARRVIDLERSSG